jgi:hypothetical protein
MDGLHLVKQKAQLSRILASLDKNFLGLCCFILKLEKYLLLADFPHI